MPRARTVRIGAESFSADCPIPRDGIGFFEGIALSVRGWLDARKNEHVADEAHTHSLHRLLAVHRRREAEATRRTDEALSALDRALAPLEALLGRREETPQAMPSVQELANLADEARAGWAERTRSARASQQSAAADSMRRRQAEDRVAVLLSIRDGLRVEAEDVRRQWREAYAMRAARYTRARFARARSAVSSVPAVAEYRHVEPPVVARRAAS